MPKQPATIEKIIIQTHPYCKYLTYSTLALLSNVYASAYANYIGATSILSLEYAFRKYIKFINNYYRQQVYSLTQKTVELTISVKAFLNYWFFTTHLIDEYIAHKQKDPTAPYNLNDYLERQNHLIANINLQNILNNLENFPIFIEPINHALDFFTTIMHSIQEEDSTDTLLESRRFFLEKTVDVYKTYNTTFQKLANSLQQACEKFIL